MDILTLAKIKVLADLLAALPVPTQAAPLYAQRAVPATTSPARADAITARRSHPSAVSAQATASVQLA
jgi:hypothetical protein